MVRASLACASLARASFCVGVSRSCEFFCVRDPCVRVWCVRVWRVRVWCVRVWCASSLRPFRSSGFVGSRFSNDAPRNCFDQGRVGAYRDTKVGGCCSIPRGGGWTRSRRRRWGTGEPGAPGDFRGGFRRPPGLRRSLDASGGTLAWGWGEERGWKGRARPKRCFAGFRALFPDTCGDALACGRGERTGQREWNAVNRG